MVIAFSSVKNLIPTRTQSAKVRRYALAQGWSASAKA
jgi:hypothetical protein